MIHRINHRTTLLAAHFLLAGCTSQSNTGAATDAATKNAAQAIEDGGLDAAGARNGENATDVTTGRNGENAPTFTAVYETVFRKFCFQSFCHGGNAVGFDTSSKDAAYHSLVGVPANPNRECADIGLVRVAPEAPDQSLLFLKLSGMNVPCGQQMPIGGELKPELKLLIEQWIAAGAHNN